MCKCKISCTYKKYLYKIFFIIHNRCACFSERKIKKYFCIHPQVVLDDFFLNFMYTYSAVNILHKPDSNFFC